MRSTLSTSRSFVLAALRALHLDPRPRSTAKSTGDNEERISISITHSTPLRGSSTQISARRFDHYVDFGGRSTMPLVLTADHGAVRLLTLNRPEARKALSRDLIRATYTPLTEADADDPGGGVGLAGADPAVRPRVHPQE